jgi:hypothetical protein
MLLGYQGWVEIMMITLVYSKRVKPYLFAHPNPINAIISCQLIVQLMIQLLIALIGFG